MIRLWTNRKALDRVQMMECCAGKNTMTDGKKNIHHFTLTERGGKVELADRNKTKSQSGGGGGAKIRWESP